MGRPEEAAVKQVRGSTLLLTGRAVSGLLNGVAQILLARALTKGEYGAFAYGLAAVAFAEFLTTFGLNRAITRYVPVYEERREYGKVIGTVVLIFATIVSLGFTVVLLVHIFAGSIEQLLIDDRQAVGLLAILIALTPIEALNHMTDGILAVLGRPGAIFFRKHIFAPVLRVVAVALLLWQGASPRVLAFAYVGIGLAGILLYAGMLVRALRVYAFPVREAWQKVQFPFREITGFVVPLLTAGLAGLAIEASDVFILGRLAGTAEVAEIRAVHPLAHYVRAFPLSFTLMFTALAARLYARNDRSGINSIYWRTACWIALLSFPIFAMTSVFAGPLVMTLFGARYADSASILAILACGYYVHGSLGLNDHVLAVFGRTKYLFTVHLIVLVFAITLMVALVPPFGAWGAAVGKASALVSVNVLLQAGLRRDTGVRVFDTRFKHVYLALVGGIVGLWLLQTTLNLGLLPGIAVTGVVWLVLLVATRRSLEIGAIFPEVRRIPIARLLVDEPEDDGPVSPAVS